MITSFRLRLAILSALLSGCALVVFGAVAWWQIRNVRLSRIDSGVRSHAERECNRTRDAVGWQRTAATMGSEIGVRDASDLQLLVQDGSGNTVYRSAGWPENLDAARILWPKAAGRRASTPQGRNGAERSDAESTRVPAFSDQRRPEPPPGPPPASASIAQTFEGHEWRIGLAASSNSRVAVAVDAHTIDADMRGIRNAFLVALPLALLLIGTGGWIFSERALRPVQKLTAATRRVTASGLDQRIAVHGEDREFVELIEVFNGMLERLERSFNQAYRFSADAAHELKTPLAIIQGQLERAIHSVEDGSAAQAELTSILDEVRRLSTISRKLLLLSQADAGRLNLHKESFDVSKALGDLVEDAKMLAPHLQISADVASELVVMADGALLRQVFHNLMSNAIKYNIEGGWVRISARRAENDLEVTVANSSSGIPDADREKVFERFYRADSARSRAVDGVGLGLSVSREIARAHGGELSLRSTGSGVVEFLFTIALASPEGANFQGSSRPLCATNTEA